MSQNLNGNERKESYDSVVTIRAERKHHTAEYKQRILDEIDAASEPGQIGAILRREGLYSQIISKWRHQRQQGRLNGSTDVKRGPRPSPEGAELERLRAENERLQKRLEQAELIIEVQKKVSQMLGMSWAANQPEEKR
jgi:transposase-like protein